MCKTRILSILVFIVGLLLPVISFAQKITTPKEHFGFSIGDDYHLANFEQTKAYFNLLNQQSDRLQLAHIGETEEGRQQPMLIISHPDNLKQLEKYKNISQTLSGADLNEEQARQLSLEGKSVVWIDGGLHSTETVAMHQLIQLAYLLTSQNDHQTLDILNNCIVLLIHANPDGQDLVSNWYMKNPIPEERVLSNIPKLYQKYAGHDNNRDFFMLNLKETQNMARQLFVEWTPQIMYNHHQTAPAGAVVAGAPYRDPFNYVFDPLLMSSIDALGAAMSTKLNSENKPGYTQRGGSVFSTWYNGGLRTTTYFHNIIGLLTEIIGGPNPWEIPLVTQRLLPTSDTQNPVIPQTWHFQQSIDYSMSLNYAVLGYASKYKEQVLYNMYRMGRNSIDKGNKDTWSLSPSKIALIDSAYSKAKRENPELEKQRYMPKDFLNALYDNPQYRDPRAYIIPASQKDLGTAIKFLNTLIGTGIDVEIADQDFEVNGQSYPSGSYIVRLAQAFRPHILDMFEPQDHPNDFAYPGGPPIAPYDAAGWTLAYLMDVEFDRVYDELPNQFRKLTHGESIQSTNTTYGKDAFATISAQANDSYTLANAILEENINVWRDPNTGDFWFQNNEKTQNLSKPYHLVAQYHKKRPSNTVSIRKKRIALWDRYGGSMPSGWIRWIGEQYKFDISVVYPPQIDKGNLIDHYDVIILPATALPNSKKVTSQTSIPPHIPEQEALNWGRLTADVSVAQLNEFMQQGGQVISIGSNTGLPELFDIQVQNILVDAEGKALDRSVYYTPGSVLTANVQQNLPSTYGLNSKLNIYFSNNSVYKIEDPSIEPLLWFDTTPPLKSGWSWGEQYLQNGVIAYQKNIGKGKLTVFTTDITFRAQAHGSFKLLFNQLFKNKN